MSPAISLVAAALVASSQVSSPAPAPLAPGKDAGLHSAQAFEPDDTLFITAGVGLIAVAAVLISIPYHTHKSDQSGDEPVRTTK